MFLQLKKLHSKSGVVLFMVLMVAIIIMIISASILTQSMNENNYAQQQVDQIVSDQLAKGLFWNAYSNAYASGSMATMFTTNVGISTVMSGRTYQVSVNTTAIPGSYNAISNYDTFL